MNKETSLRAGGSLLERAAELYGFADALAAPRPPRTAETPGEVEEVEPAAVSDGAVADQELAEAACAEDQSPSLVSEGDEVEGEAFAARAPASLGGGRAIVDRGILEAGGFILPDAPGGALPEEFRVVKRQLLLAMENAPPRDRVILVASAQPGDGKSFCALNLALSIAGEKDLEVLLVDGDVAKSELPTLLGIETSAGLIDAILDHQRDPESLVIETDIPGLSLLPAGSRTPEAPELLASARTSELLAALTESHPRRIVIFDSPPVLCASPAIVLAGLAGQVVMVVRADRTTESDLREAVSLLSASDNISLVLNGTRLLGGGSRFGSYYGYGP